MFKRKMLQNSVGVLTEKNTYKGFKLPRNCSSSSSPECYPLNTQKIGTSRPVDGRINLNSFSKPKVMKASSVEKEWMPTDFADEADDFGNFCFSDALIVQPLDVDFSSAKELHIHLLKTKKPPRGAQHTVACAPLEVLGEGNAKPFLQCMICGLVGNPLKMLICDLCENAFHLHCCREKKPFSEDWYCQPCLQKEPIPIQESNREVPFANIDRECRRRISQRNLGHVLFMLKDSQPYTSKVRIGSDYQADIPQWSGPISNDYDCFGESSELGSEECSDLDGWKLASSKGGSIGSWLQCRARNDNKVICGKWRRAPLFATQTDDWDCSCSVIWDPFHADCAVPQELETEEVLKQLKFVQSLKSRIDKRQKSGRTEVTAPNSCRRC